MTHVKHCVCQLESCLQLVVCCDEGVTTGGVPVVTGVCSLASIGTVKIKTIKL